MKRILTITLLIFILLSCIGTPAFSSPNPYPGRIYLVEFLTIDELVEFLETEDEENFSIYRELDSSYNEISYPAFIHTFLQYRERGKVLECYYAEETGISEGRKAIWHDQTEKEKAGILEYRFSHDDEHITIRIELLKEDELASIEKSGLQEYLETALNVSDSCRGEMNTTIASGEKITFLNYGAELAFVYEGHLIRIFQDKTDQIKYSFINQLHLKMHTVEKKPTKSGYGKLLLARKDLNSIGSNGSLHSGGKTSHEEMYQELCLLLEKSYENYEHIIFNETYIPAVAGTIDNPDGVYGKYSYQIKLTDSYSRTITTDLFTKDIKPKIFIGIDELKTEGNEVAVKIAPKQGSFHLISLAFYRDNVFLGRESEWTDVERTQSFSAKIPEEANRIKAFLWDYHSVTDFVTGQKDYLFINPACPALEITKNEQGEWE